MIWWVWKQVDELALHSSGDLEGGYGAVVFTSNTGQKAATQTSEMDRAAIPFRLAVQCQYPGQYSSLTAVTNLTVVGRAKLWQW